jgi:hypothetical protein
MTTVMATCARPMASPSRLCRSRARWALTRHCWLTSWSFRVGRCRLLAASRLRQQANAAHAVHRHRAIGSRHGQRQLFSSGRRGRLKAESRISWPLRQGLSRAAGHRAAAGAADGTGTAHPGRVTTARASAAGPPRPRTAACRSLVIRRQSLAGVRYSSSLPHRARAGRGPTRHYPAGRWPPRRSVAARLLPGQHAVNGGAARYVMKG